MLQRNNLFHYIYTVEKHNRYNSVVQQQARDYTN